MQDLTPKKFVTSPGEVPKLGNGLTPLLRKHLDLQALQKHRAMLVVELEIIAKKFDRFGWERDSGTATQDGLILDWMDALQDYPIDEVRAACRAAVLENPDKMPNEGHVKAQIRKARKVIVERNRKPEPVRERRVPTDQERRNVARLVEEAGYAPRRMRGAR